MLSGLKNKLESALTTLVTGAPSEVTRFRTFIPTIDGVPRVDLAGVFDYEKLVREGYIQHLISNRTNYPKIGLEEVTIRCVKQPSGTVYVVKN